MIRIIALAADHGGFPLKVEFPPWLRSQGHEISDLGAHSLDPDDDYPDFAEATAREVASGRAERGIVICGSGVGASVAANKVPGIRAFLCYDVYSAHQGAEHDELHVLCLGARVVGGCVGQRPGVGYPRCALHRRGTASPPAKQSSGH